MKEEPKMPDLDRYVEGMPTYMSYVEGARRYQMPYELLVPEAEAAEVQAKKIREAGNTILKLTESDVDNLILAGKMDAPVASLKLTEAMQITLHENYERLKCRQHTEYVPN